MVSGPNQVEIRSKSGPNQVRAEGFSWVGARGVGPGGRVPVAPRKVSKIIRGELYYVMAGAPLHRFYAMTPKIVPPEFFYVMANPVHNTQNSRFPSVIS